jgi:hypothetical protein
VQPKRVNREAGTLDPQVKLDRRTIPGGALVELQQQPLCLLEGLGKLSKPLRTPRP